MKTILHCALIAPGGYSNKPFIEAFLNNGFAEYHCFDFQLQSYTFGRDVMRRMLIHEAEKIKPDMIFMQIQGSDILDLETFRALSKIAFTVNYTFDIRTNEQTQWLYDLAEHVGLVCFSNQDDADECNRRGHDNAMVIQSSCDMDVYKPMALSSRPLISFVGSNYLNTSTPFPRSGERWEMVRRLKKRYGEMFSLFGPWWSESRLTHPGQDVNIHSASLIGINHNNFRQKLYTSDRLWRIMATGAMCLTSYFPGIETMFDRYRHLDWWETLDELEGKIDHYLDEPEKTKWIAENGMNHVRENHTWTARVNEMMAFIKTIEAPEVEVYYADACLKAGAHVIDGQIPGEMDEHLAGKPCACGKLKGVWVECGCAEKKYQFRWAENN